MDRTGWDRLVSWAGLLIAIAPADAPRLERELAARAVPVHRVGACVAHEGPWIELV